MDCDTKTAFRLLTAAAIVVAISSYVYPQSPMPAPPFGPTHIGGEERPDAPTKDDIRRIPHPQRQFGPVREKPVLKKGILAPAAEDVAANSTFLRQSNTGLIKLLPREQSGGQTQPTPKRAKVRGGGAYYSFFYLSHDNIYGADITLDHNSVSVDFKEPDYGIITELGDVSLNELASGEARAAFLDAYKPARNAADARCELKTFRQGVNSNGSVYKLALPVKVNSSYLVRSINYRRSDQLVAFRVTRQNPDGSVIIAWKLLKQYWRPTFERVVYVNIPTDKCPIK